MKPFSKKATDKYPGQEKAVPFGFPPKGTFAYEPYKQGGSERESKMAMYWDHVKESLFEHGSLWSTVVKELKSKFADISAEDITELKEHARKYTQQKQSSEFGLMDGPKDIGRDPSGDFPSVSWMPKGQEDKDVSSNASLKKEADSWVTVPVQFKIDDESILQYANGTTYGDKIRAGEMSDKDWEALLRDTARWMTQVGRDKVYQTFFVNADWKMDAEQIGKLRRMFEALPKGSSLTLEARFDMPYWIDPNGKEYELRDATHDVWAERNQEMLKKTYGIDFSKMNPKRDSYMSFLIDNGWTRAGVSDHGMLLHTKDLSNLKPLDMFVAKKWDAKNFNMLQIETYDHPMITLDDPFPSLEKALKRNRFSKKAEDVLSQDEQNEIAAKFGPETNVALKLFADAVQNGHPRDRAFAYALERAKDMRAPVSEKNLLQAIRLYLKGRV